MQKKPLKKSLSPKLPSQVIVLWWALCFRQNRVWHLSQHFTRAPRPRPSPLPGRRNETRKTKNNSHGSRSQGPRRRSRRRLRLGGARRRREARVCRGCGGAIVLFFFRFEFEALAGRLCRGPGLLDYLCRRREDHSGPSRGGGAPGGRLGLDGKGEKKVEREQN